MYNNFQFLMVYVMDKCRNCGTTRGKEGRDIAVYQCNNCNFVGCHGTGVFTHVGCWLTPHCPKCGENKGSKRIGWLD
jgi:predicted RNA-binding Zn-ribbon protein involved in translation (DUF1610 family)